MFSFQLTGCIHETQFNRLRAISSDGTSSVERHHPLTVRDVIEIDGDCRHTKTLSSGELSVDERIG
jgi:hypothetical protein